MTFDFRFLFARLKIRDLRQHHVQKSACFTRLAPSPYKRAEKFPAIAPSHRPATCRPRRGHGFLSTCALRGGRGGFLAKNHQRAAQRHARRQQTGEQPREIFQILRRNFFGLELERKICRSIRRLHAGFCCRAVFGLAAAFSARLTGRRPSASIWRNASGGPALRAGLRRSCRRPAMLCIGKQAWAFTVEEFFISPPQCSRRILRFRSSCAWPLPWRSSRSKLPRPW